MDFYRIKHKPTGLYYKPGDTNLSKKGKIYTSGGNVLSYYKDEKTIPVQLSQKQFDEFGKNYDQRRGWHNDPKVWWRPIQIPREEFVIEPVNI